MRGRRKTYEDGLGRFFRSAPIATAILDYNGIVKVVNPALARLLCSSEDEMCGRSILEFVSAESAVEFQKSLRQSVTEAVDTEIVLDCVPEARPARAFVFPAGDDSRYIIVQFLDHSRLESLEETARGGEVEDASLRAAMERSASEWRATFDAVETPVVVVDDGRVTRINRAARLIAGRSYDEIIGQPLLRVSTEEPWVRIDELARRVVETNAPHPGQVTDDLGRTWDLLAMPLRVGPENRHRVIVVGWDVTQIVSLQATVSQSEPMLAMGALLAGVAHEVRNPLFAISATLDALESEIGPKYPDYFKVLHEELDRLTNLMQDLLLYGKRSSSFDYVNLNEVLKRAASSCGTVSRNSSVTVEQTTSCSENLRILADRDRLERAIQNIMLNAIQHSPAGASVDVNCTIVADRNQEWVELMISDRGKGFAPEDLPRLFEPFFSRRKGGTGLGLAITEQIVGEHGGRLRAANREGGGAVVTMRLPKERADRP